MHRAQLVDLIATTVTDFALPAPGVSVEPIDETTSLFGADGLLDSIGLVSVVLDIEQQVNDRLGISISIADDRAMSQKRSPFRTVGRLADYVLTLIEEQHGT
jgi:acyl carrier protein